MGKVIIIDYCDECPHFDSGYDHEKAECKRLSGKPLVERKKYDYYYKRIIPDDCPLIDDTEIVTEFGGTARKVG